MIRRKIYTAIGKVLTGIGISSGDFVVERAPIDSGADYSTNAALVFAKEAGMSPQALAEKIAESIRVNGDISGASVAGPGFVNITLAEQSLLNGLDELEKKLLKGFSFRNDNLNIEFISANPTGALHIGHGRGAFYGDVVARVLSYTGANVTREFYINDSRESKQIRELGKTARGEGAQYKTPELEEKINAMNFSKMDEAEAGFALAAVVQQENTRFIGDALGVPIDVWYSEDEKLRGSGIVATLFDVFKEREFVYEKEGAWWIKTSEYGDDEDRVVKRSDGTWSYFMADIAYHADKVGRGHDGLIDVWGADHHGHVKRMRAVQKMLGWDVDFKIFITQLVSLKKDGLSAKMSKRAGNVVLLSDMVDEIGIDALRWFFLEKALGTHMEFDVELAKKQSAENPVYYAQYAHARAAGILENIKNAHPDGVALVDIINMSATRALAMKILQFPDIVEDISHDYFVHKLTTYAHELAAQFNQFYRDVRVLSDDSYASGAAELVGITKKTLAQTLSLLGISTPEKM